MNRFFEKALFYLITGTFLFIGNIGKIIGRKNRLALGKFIGIILKKVGGERRNITFSNIQAAFPEKNVIFHKLITDQSYQNLGITFIELLAMKKANIQQVQEMIEYKNIELLKEVYSRGNGLILLSGHFGNWELLAYSAGLLSSIPVTVIVKPQKNYVADNYLNQIRISGGNKIVSMYNAARKMISAIKNKEAIALLADQSGTEDKDIFLEFFGRYASVYEAPAALSLRFQVPIVMGFAVRNADGKYEVELSEIPMHDLQADKQGIEELTRRHTAVLEEAIRKNPGLWAWQHRRWKHEDAGLRQNETQNI